jgi:hypothetical protein
VRGAEVVYDEHREDQQDRQSVHPRQEEKQESSGLVVEKDVAFIKAQ